MAHITLILDPVINNKTFGGVVTLDEDLRCDFKEFGDEVNIRSVAKSNNFNNL